MRIAVCFKTVPDYTRLSAKDWVWDDHHAVDTGFVRQLYNCFEESALEIALTLGDTAGAGAEPNELTALTVAGPQDDLFLKHLAAVGYDHLVRIECAQGVDLRFNPEAVSELLAAYIRSEAQQFVFLGQQGAEGDNGQTGFLLAERLGWPCFHEVSVIAWAQTAGSLEVTRRIPGATLNEIIAPPAVLIAGHCPDTPYLRVPTLKQKLAAKQKVIQCLSPSQLGCGDRALKASAKTLMGLQHPPVKPPCVFLKGASSREEARQLYGRYLQTSLAP